jgi:glycosyltransferase involved in cell wall biosynthesis
MPDMAYASAPRLARTNKSSVTLIMVGTLAQLYKAPDVLIDAFGRCVQNGMDLKLVMVGDGKFRAQLEQQAADLGVADRVWFTGQLPAGKPVRDQLDQADLFVLPSHGEGLPRAMIEAMARALPCIGSDIGGIAELIPPEDRIRSGDAAALAQKIREVVSDPIRMARMSARNLGRAAEYRSDILYRRRREFYSYVKEQTEAWQKTAHR